MSWPNVEFSNAVQSKNFTRLALAISDAVGHLRAITLDASAALNSDHKSPCPPVVSELLMQQLVIILEIMSILESGKPDKSFGMGGYTKDFR